MVHLNKFALYCFKYNDDDWFTSPRDTADNTMYTHKTYEKLMESFINKLTALSLKQDDAIK